MTLPLNFAVVLVLVFDELEELLLDELVLTFADAVLLGADSVEPTYARTE